MKSPNAIELGSLDELPKTTSRPSLASMWGIAESDSPPTDSRIRSNLPVASVGEDTTSEAPKSSRRTAQARLGCDRSHLRSGASCQLDHEPSDSAGGTRYEDSSTQELRSFPQDTQSSHPRHREGGGDCGLHAIRQDDDAIGCGGHIFGPSGLIHPSHHSGSHRRTGAVPGGGSDYPCDILTWAPAVGALRNEMQFAPVDRGRVHSQQGLIIGGNGLRGIEHRYLALRGYERSHGAASQVDLIGSAFQSSKQVGSIPLPQCSGLGCFLAREVGAVLRLAEHSQAFEVTVGDQYTHG